jgi:hypothetical protein
VKDVVIRSLPIVLTGDDGLCNVLKCVTSHRFLSMEAGLEEQEVMRTLDSLRRTLMKFIYSTPLFFLRLD